MLELIDQTTRPAIPYSVYEIAGGFPFPERLEADDAFVRCGWEGPREEIEVAKQEIDGLVRDAVGDAPRGRVEVAGLARELSVTPETVRRDLTALERRGVLRRVHGGAIAVERLGIEPHVADREGSAAGEKERIARAALDELPDGARVVALTSDHTVHNLPYGASKGALDRIVIAAARELAHLGISSNAVNPGPVDTGWMDDDTRRTLTALQPSGRLGTPEDVSRTIRFLMSPEGRWVTGQLITTDGGISV